MKIFDRYIGRQVLTSAFFAVTVLTIILVLGKVFKDLLAALVERPDLDAGFIFKFLVLVLPISLSISVPWAFLTSILLIFGRLSADSELISLRMAGMSMPRICLSVGIIAIAFTGLCGWMNIVLAPAAKSEMQNMKNTFINMAKQNPLSLFKDGKVMAEIPRHLIFATKEEVEPGDEANPDRQLTRFQMVKMNDYFRPDAIVIAKDVDVDVVINESLAEMEFGMRDAYLGLKRSDEEVTDFAEYTPISADFMPWKVPLDKLKQREERLKPDVIPFADLFTAIKQPGLTSTDRVAIKTEISRRLSFSLACITLGLIAIPLGITAQRRETSVGFALSLIVGIVYFLLMTIAEMTKGIPYILVWMPNVIFLIVGVIQFRKLARK